MDLEHNFVLWLFTQAFALVLFMWAALVAAATGPGAFFYTMWAVVTVLALVVLPSWPLLYLGGSDRDEELDEKGVWHV